VLVWVRVQQVQRLVWDEVLLSQRVQAWEY
jgi:hypothetical protein